MNTDYVLTSEMPADLTKEHYEKRPNDGSKN